jgi:(4S)-4-hydroxy-5-phosphonooxypentane-2,3-dione isomerase
MLTRIVRMTFHPHLVNDFLAVFDASKSDISNQRGCLGLSLFVDAQSDNVLYTISHWASEADLEAYRNSDLFQTTWTKTKAFFQDKPLAFSLNELELVKPSIIGQ